MPRNTSNQPRRNPSREVRSRSASPAGTRRTRQTSTANARPPPPVRHRYRTRSRSRSERAASEDANLDPPLVAAAASITTAKHAPLRISDLLSKQSSTEISNLRQPATATSTSSAKNGPLKISNIISGTSAGSPRNGNQKRPTDPAEDVSDRPQKRHRGSRDFITQPSPQPEKTEENEGQAKARRHRSTRRPKPPSSNLSPIREDEETNTSEQQHTSRKRRKLDSDTSQPQFKLPLAEDTGYGGGYGGYRNDADDLYSPTHANAWAARHAEQAAAMRRQLEQSQREYKGAKDKVLASLRRGPTTQGMLTDMGRDFQYTQPVQNRGSLGDVSTGPEEVRTGPEEIRSSRNDIRQSEVASYVLQQQQHYERLRGSAFTRPTPQNAPPPPYTQTQEDVRATYQTRHQQQHRQHTPADVQATHSSAPAPTPLPPPPPPPIPKTPPPGPRTPIQEEEAPQATEHPHDPTTKTFLQLCAAMLTHLHSTLTTPRRSQLTPHLDVSAPLRTILAEIAPAAPHSRRIHETLYALEQAWTSEQLTAAAQRSPRDVAVLVLVLLAPWTEHHLRLAEVSPGVEAEFRAVEERARALALDFAQTDSRRGLEGLLEREVQLVREFEGVLRRGREEVYTARGSQTSSLLAMLGLMRSVRPYLPADAQLCGDLARAPCSSARDESRETPVVLDDGDSAWEDERPSEEEVYPSVEQEDVWRVDDGKSMSVPDPADFVDEGDGDDGGDDEGGGEVNEALALVAGLDEDSDVDKEEYAPPHRYSDDQDDKIHGRQGEDDDDHALQGEDDDYHVLQGKDNDEAQQPDDTADANEPSAPRPPPQRTYTPPPVFDEESSDDDDGDDDNDDDATNAQSASPPKGKAADRPRASSPKVPFPPPYDELSGEAHKTQNLMKIDTFYRLDEKHKYNERRHGFGPLRSAKLREIAEQDWRVPVVGGDGRRNGGGDRVRRNPSPEGDGDGDGDADVPDDDDDAGKDPSDENGVDADNANDDDDHDELRPTTTVDNNLRSRIHDRVIAGAAREGLQLAAQNTPAYPPPATTPHPPAKPSKKRKRPAESDNDLGDDEATPPPRKGKERAHTSTTPMIGPETADAQPQTSSRGLGARISSQRRSARASGSSSLEPALPALPPVRLKTEAERENSATTARGRKRR